MTVDRSQASLTYLEPFCWPKRATYQGVLIFPTTSFAQKKSAHPEIPRAIITFGDSMDFFTLIAFTAAFFVFAASPGPDNMAIIAHTISHGAASAIAYGAGTVVGILVFLTLAAFGLSVIAGVVVVASR